jgi:hypothetical protein
MPPGPGTSVRRRGDRQHTFGVILAEIADPLEIGRNADRADDFPQIVGQRLTPRYDGESLVVDVALRVVEQVVIFDDLLRQGRIIVDER